MDEKGDPLRTINIKDGYAIQLAVKHGLQLAIMTGGHNENVRSRYEYLGVKDVYISCSMKIRTWEEFLKKYDLKEEEIISFERKDFDDEDGTVVYRSYIKSPLWDMPCLSFSITVFIV